MRIAKPLYNIARMNFYRQLIVFILLWLIIPLIMVLLNIPLKNLLLIGVPIFFAVYNFIKGVIAKSIKKLVSFFLLTALFILIAIKIEYHYYNFVIHSIIVLVGVFVFKPWNKLKSDKLKFLGNSLILINLILLITPNYWILNQLNHQKKSWTPYIEWSDFQGNPEKQSQVDAIITTNFRYKVNKAFNYPSAVISTYMIQNESWKKEINNEEAKRELLNHEQGHFNIAKAHEKFAIDSIKKIWGASPKQSENVINYFIDKNDITQEKYDSITNHGSITRKQRDWDILIGKWLK